MFIAFQGRSEKTLSGKYEAQALVSTYGLAPSEVRRLLHRAWVLLRTIKRIRASDGCLGIERR